MSYFSLLPFDVNDGDPDDDDSSSCRQFAFASSSFTKMSKKKREKEKERKQATSTQNDKKDAILPFPLVTVVLLSSLSLYLFLLCMSHYFSSHFLSLFVMRCLLTLSFPEYLLHVLILCLSFVSILSLIIMISCHVLFLSWFS